MRQDGNYPGIDRHPGVQDSRGQWISDQSTQFDVLYAYRCREFLEGADTNRLADNFQQAADDLQSMYMWHGAAGAADILQIALSEYLSHGVTHTPITIDEILSDDVLFALDGMVCRAEMVRFGNQLEEIAAELRSYNRGSMTDSEAAFLCMSLEDAINRIDPLADAGINWVSINDMSDGYPERHFRLTRRTGSNTRLRGCSEISEYHSLMMRRKSRNLRRIRPLFRSTPSSDLR